MKKILSLFVLALCVSNIMAQGLVKENSPRPEIKKADKEFTFDDIQFWTGEGSKQAAIVIQWADENTPNSIVWGYRWDGDATGLDMAIAVAEADPRLVILTQYTGSMGNTICGIGYGEEPFNVIYGGDEDKAAAEKAIEEGLKNGVIYHPFNAETCGSPSYDYDSWTAEGALHWNAGWYQGYWSYNVRDNQTDDFSYSGLGVSSRVLEDGSWDAWLYSSFSEGMAELSDKFTAATILPTGIKNAVSNARVIADGRNIRFVNMNGYECRISDIAGNMVKSFTVSGDNETVSLSVAGGMYIVSATDGENQVSSKFVVR